VARALSRTVPLSLPYTSGGKLEFYRLDVEVAVRELEQETKRLR
jgi:hypothetical protein